MTNPYLTARILAQTIISHSMRSAEEPLTSGRIREVVDQVCSMNPEWSSSLDRAMLARELETMFNTWIGNIRTLDANSDQHQPWLHLKKMQISWRYWQRYEQLLRDKGWAERTLRKLDEMTDHTLERIEDPARAGPWDIRGLVVGQVQSGKTSNYIGLINKAVDAGYKVIIVLAGPYNNLRAQTQLRVDEGFLGYDSRRYIQGSGAIPCIGVGHIDPSVPRPNTGTNSTEGGDFKLDVSRSFNINPGNDSLLFVVKKERRILNQIITWVDGAATSRTEDGRNIVTGVPLLVIDDECDYGSIDTRIGAIDEFGNPDPEHDPTIINSLVRKILYKFEKSVYLGYTATPFANIFIHEAARTTEEGDDLFPRNFITCLPSPTNYIGPSRVFGIDEDYDPEEDEEVDLPLVREVTDHADTMSLKETHGWMPPKHRIDHIPRYNGENTVPPSLREALHCFILSCAARKARGQTTAHNSMLIHIPRYTAVQERIKDQIEEEIGAIRRRLDGGDSTSVEQLLTILKRLWDEDYRIVTEQFHQEEFPLMAWTLIEPYIHTVVKTIQIRHITGYSTDILDYDAYHETGINLIVIGGDKLSRGLTLEGLTIGYFLRPTRMYDTLMQMGRWFGYRPGYLDLCRLYTRPDIIDWYRKIAHADEELRREFNHMTLVGGTPIDYGFRVRVHPELAVTSPIKMRNASKVSYSYSACVNVTTVFHRDNANIERNYARFVKLLEMLDRSGANKTSNPERRRSNGFNKKWKGSTLWENVESDIVIEFLKGISTYPSAIRVNGNRMGDYIEHANRNGFLIRWSVVVLSGKGAIFKIPVLGEHSTNVRGWDKTIPENQQDTYPTFTVKTVMSPPDETIDLTDEEYDLAFDLSLAYFRTSGDEAKGIKEPERPYGDYIREKRNNQRGLLLIYPLDPKWIKPADGVGLPLIGLTLSFPKIPKEYDTNVTYVVNNTELQQEFG